MSDNTISKKIEEEKEIDAYTLKELADLCGCAKNTAKKQVERLALNECSKLIGQRLYPAYYASKDQIAEIREKVLSNKNISVSASTSAHITPLPAQSQPMAEKQAYIDYKAFNDLEEKYQAKCEDYYNIKQLLAVAESNNRLLTDQQGGLVQQMRDMTKEKEALIAEKAKIETRLEEKERESTNYKRLSFYTSLFAGLILLSVVVALVFKVLLH